LAKQPLPPIRRPAAGSPFIVTHVLSPMATVGDATFGRGWDLLARILTRIGVMMMWLGTQVGRGGLAVGGSLGSAGKFVVLGHHSIKTRTCPRIEIEG
jgi:hypothetical protein